MPISISFITATLSFGLSYGIFILISVIIAFIDNFLYSIVKNDFYINIVSFPLISIVQLLVTKSIFRINRLKNGMPFLQHEKVINVGVVICLIFLFATLLFNSSPGNKVNFISYLFIVFSSGTLLTVWWFNRLKLRYKERIQSREISNLENRIMQLQSENTSLKENNNELAKIIHKDNKLIPAMEYAVIELLNCDEIKSLELNNKANDLRQYLMNLSEERTGMLNSYEIQNRHLPSTGIASFDAILRYMNQKATIQNVDFQFLENSSVKYFVDNIISVEDLNTLVADLVENAIIALKNLKNPRILLCICIENTHYSLDIYDNGPQFDVNVIANLGKKQITTHAETGGSGIGMMTTFEILNKYSASFILKETPNDHLYKKKISICFDGRAQIEIKSMRPELLQFKSSI